MNGQILFVTDGSISANQAGEMAINLALSLKLPMKVVFILDEGWKRLLGDEWISAPSTRSRFYNWFEDGLIKHSETILQKFAEKVKAVGGQVEVAIEIGKTEKLILDLTEEKDTSLLVLPNPHATAPAAEAGLRFNLNSLSKKVKCPIYLGPR